MPVDIPQDRIELMLSALKIAESQYTQEGLWDAAKKAGKLNASLRKQIFSYEEVKEPQ